MYKDGSRFTWILFFSWRYENQKNNSFMASWWQILHSLPHTSQGAMCPTSADLAPPSVKQHCMVENWNHHTFFIGEMHSIGNM
jgi:hypothetical protein